MPNNIEAKFEALSDALEMVDDAIEAARHALLENPGKEERRRLNELILELEAKRAKIVNKMIALGRKTRAVAMPSKAKIAKLKKLAAEVDELTRAAQGAGRAIQLADQVLDLAGELKFA